MTLAQTPSNMEEFGRGDGYFNGEYNNTFDPNFYNSQQMPHVSFPPQYQPFANDGFRDMFEEGQQGTYSVMTPQQNQQNLDFFEIDDQSTTNDMNIFLNGGPAPATPNGIQPYQPHTEVDPSLLQQNAFHYGHNQQIPSSTFNQPYQGEPMSLINEDIEISKYSTTVDVKHGQMTPPKTLSPTSVDSPNNAGSRRSLSAIEPTSQQPPTSETTAVPQKKRRGRKPKNKDLSPEAATVKRDQFLERNRNAAAKCRSKKKNWTSNLQDKVKFVSEENDRLHSELAAAKSELDGLRADVILHARVCKNAEDLHVCIDEFARQAGIGAKRMTALPSRGATPMQHDPSIARVNTDYTDKRSIPMSRKGSNFSSDFAGSPGHSSTSTPAAGTPKHNLVSLGNNRPGSAPIPLTPGTETVNHAHKRHASLDFGYRADKSSSTDNESITAPLPVSAGLSKMNLLNHGDYFTNQNEIEMVQ